MGTLNLGSTGTITATSLSLGVVPCFSVRTNYGQYQYRKGTNTTFTPIPFLVY